MSFHFPCFLSIDVVIYLDKKEIVEPLYEWAVSMNDMPV